MCSCFRESAEYSVKMTVFERVFEMGSMEGNIEEPRPEYLKGDAPSSLHMHAWLLPKNMLKWQF